MCIRDSITRAYNTHLVDVSMGYVPPTDHTWSMRTTDIRTYDAVVAPDGSKATFRVSFKVYLVEQRCV